MSAPSNSLTTQYNLRWSEELKEKIVDSSKDNNRSINQEIIARLEQSFLKEHSPPAPTKKVDVYLQVTPYFDAESEEDEYQNLILQFDPCLIPTKGDILEIENMAGGSTEFEVTKRRFNTTTNGYIIINLVVRRSENWD